MTFLSIKNKSLSIAIFCRIFGHHFTISKQITSHIKEYKCKHCGSEITSTSIGTRELLNDKNKKVNQTLAAFYQKKQILKKAL